MTENYSGAVFWIEVDKIQPNPFQPRREFDEDKLRALADSIRQYGILQPLVVTRKEVEREDGGLVVEYELIAGERRWRAARLAGIMQVPSIIRDGEDSDKLKLEMAIIENLQREDLNPIDRANAFQRLVDEFKLKHLDIAKRVGKSREYVSNTIRILALPEEMLQAVVDRKMTEGHTRPILMLSDRPEEQATLFRDIIARKMTVREAEQVARRIAYDRVRNKAYFVPPEIIELEHELSQTLGTRVKVERQNVGGKITIDFFTNDDLEEILKLLAAKQQQETASGLSPEQAQLATAEAIDDSTEEEDEELYNIKNFSI